jgi:hypothetical protein
VFSRTNGPKIGGTQIFLPGVSSIAGVPVARVAIGARTSALIALWLAGATPAAAQFLSSSTCPLQAQVIEWDLPGGGADIQPGAIFLDRRGSGVSGHPIWFVTRLNFGDGQRVYRLDPQDKKKLAPFTSWTLSPDVVSGGLRRLHVSGDRRLIAVRMLNALQLVNTEKCVKHFDGTTTCERIVFQDEAASGGTSDVAIDDRDNVFTSVTPNSVPADSYVEKLPAAQIMKQYDASNPAAVAVKVRRWIVDGGAGTCFMDSGDTCISGIAIKRGDSRFVYFSAPTGNFIGELDTEKNTIRKFPLGLVQAANPRQIDVDQEGIVWAVAGSGHLVRVDPWKKLTGCTTTFCAAISSHAMPEQAMDDPVGVTIDRGGRRGNDDRDQFRNEIVAYTEQADTQEVGLLIPDGDVKPVDARPIPVAFADITRVGVQEQAVKENGQAQPMAKKVAVQVTKNADGTFLEAQILQGGSALPFGVTPDHRGRFGTFYHAVGEAVDGDLFLKRIERVTFPRVPRRPDNPRDVDDHDDDGERDDKDADKDDDGVPNGMDKDDDNDCVPNEMDDDDDDDHLEDKYDRPDRHETKMTERAATPGGSATTYTVTTTSSTTLLTVVATASDPGAPTSIEIVNPAGAVVSAGLPTPGAALATVVPLTAGTYTVRVRNLGLSTVNTETLLITQQLPLF